MMKTKAKRKPKRLVTLTGLEGVRRKSVRSVAVYSVSEAIDFLRDGRVITASGDDGAINVWKLDNGKWRCEFCRYRSTVASNDYQYLAAVAQWLKDQWPNMQA